MALPEPAPSGASSRMPAGDAFGVQLLLATRRDGEAASKVLARAGMRADIAADLGDLVARVRGGDVGTILVSEFALAQPGFVRLVEALETQPPWSDVPVVLTLAGELPERVARLQRRLTNVTLLDRPTSVRTLASAIEAALRARRRQYEIRDRIDALERAEQALRESDRRKDTFLATLAHELRNPLAPIRNAAHVLAQPTVALERVTPLAQMINRQTRAMALLLDDLLDVARIATGKLVLKTSDVDVAAIVDTAVELARPLIDAKRHELSVRLPKGGAVVRGDPLRLAQVLSNLLTNAAKYTDAGGNLELDARVFDGWVQIAVRDDGVGLEPAMLPKVFEMFQQEEGTLGRAQGGLGIGLALARSLVEMHGGTIAAESPGKGRGSTFCIRLPAAVAAPGHAAPSDAGPDTDAPGAPTPSRLMVVDDNVDAATSLAMMLELEGYAVEVFDNGLSALDQARATHPAAMLLDIGMPGLDGYTLARRIRTEPWGPSTFLVAITGWGQAEDKHRATDAGFDAHLTKPVNPSAIIGLLGRRLAQV